MVEVKIRRAEKGEKVQIMLSLEVAHDCAQPY